MKLQTIIPLLSAALISLLVPTTEAQSNLHLNLTLYTNGLCSSATSVGFNFVQEGQCVNTGVDTTVYGQSMTVKGLWYTGPNGFWDWRAYGYVRGYTTAGGCSGPFADFYIDYCWTPPVEDRPKSFKWVRKDYTVFPLPWVPPPEPVGGVGRRREGEGGCKKPDWFEYYDGEVGRTRRVALGGFEGEVMELLGLYKAGILEKLRLLPELD